MTEDVDLNTRDHDHDIVPGISPWPILIHWKPAAGHLATDVFLVTVKYNIKKSKHN